MPGLLSGIPLTDDERRKNDGPHRPGVVLAVLAVLALYVFMLSSASSYLHLPSAREVVASLGVTPGDYFTPDGSVASYMEDDASELAGADQRLVLFLVVGAAFLCAYFLPLPFKRPSLVLWTMVAVVVLYGFRPAAGLLFSHFLVYLTLHPRRELTWACVAGALGALAFGPEPGSTPSAILAVAAAAAAGAAAGALIYRFAWRPLALNRRSGPVLRTLVVQSAMLVTVGAALLAPLALGQLELALGVLLFFWHWARLIMYHVDYSDGLVPKDVPLIDYLSIFLTPGQAIKWTWSVEIGQGYAYSTNNYLSENKNSLALAGLKLWGLGLAYLALTEVSVVFLDGLLKLIGLPVYGMRIDNMVDVYAEGGRISTGSVLATTYLDRTRFVLFWAGIAHFKVGVWRMCGYRVDPNFNMPWLATNLVSLWSRYTFHYREFLVRAFYYPTFFRFFKRQPRIRIVAATLAAACVGNMIWGHVSEAMFYGGPNLQGIIDEVSTWPYFLSLGLGIGLVQLYLLGRKRHRKPWTRDWRLPLDVLACWASFQYFSLITIFRRPEGLSNLELLRLILVGLGIHL